MQNWVFFVQFTYIWFKCRVLLGPYRYIGKVKMPNVSNLYAHVKLREGGDRVQIVQTLQNWTVYTFYPRDAMLARVIVIATRLSVTRRYCVKTKKASGVISSPSGSPKTVVFWRQISSPNSKGFPRTGASKKGRSEKFSDFFSFKRLYLETVADTAKVTISD